MNLQFITVEVDTETPADPKQQQQQKRKIRSHASAAGYQNARRNRNKGSLKVEGHSASSSTAENVNPLTAAINAFIPKQAHIKLTIRKPQGATAKNYNRVSSNETASGDDDPILAQLVPPPHQLPSAELNCPHYLHMWSNQLFPRTNDLAWCLNIYDVQHLRNIRPFLEHKGFENTLASLAYGLHQFRSGENVANSKNMLVHRGRALVELRSQIETHHVDEASLLAILYMIMLETILGNFQVTELHKQALAQLVKQKGGLEVLSEHLVSCILQQNQYWIDVGSTPILDSTTIPIPTLEFPPTPLPIQTQRQLKYLPPGFQQLALKGELASSNLDFLLRITVHHRNKQKQATLAHKSTDLEVPTANDGTYRPHHSLMNACPVLFMPTSDEIVFQKALCLALLIYSTSALCTESVYSYYVTKAQTELTSILPGLARHLTPFFYHEQCLFWIWHVTVESWRSRSGALEEPGVALVAAQQERFKVFYETERAQKIVQEFSWVWLYPSTSGRI